jgi:hypothetical protein
MLRRDRNRPSDRDLAALADGSLRGRRREQMETLVAGSPELTAIVREQRDALDAIQHAAVGAPRGLRTRLQRADHAQAARNPTRRLAPALAAAGVLAAVVLVVLTLVGSGTPTVAQAASLALRAPAGVAPAGNRGAVLPRLRAAGLPFPYWEDRFGWKAFGVRHDRLGGRYTTTVFYRRSGRQIGYTIVSGGALAPPSRARVTVRNRVRIQLFAVDGRDAVTWLRHGHTCVLSGAGVPGRVLVRLAAFRSHGAIPY